MSNPPQGTGRTRESAETIIGEVVNVTGYNANDPIFASALTPNVPVGQTIEWSIYFAFVGTQAVLEHSIDNGATFSTTFEDITTGLAYITKIAVANGDQVIFRFSKGGTINYCRVGEPL